MDLRRRHNEPHSIETMMYHHRRSAGAVLALGTVLLVLAAFPRVVLAQASPEQQAKLREAQRIMAEADSLYQQAKYREVIPLMERFVSTCRDVFGPRHGETANALNNLAVVHWKLGDNQQASKLFQEALEIQRAVLPPDDVRISATLTNLGNVAEREGNLLAARKFTEQALELELKYRGADHAQSATALNRMGTLLKMEYRYEEARAYMDRALAIRRRIFGENHKDTAESLNNIGTLLSDHGDYAGAKPYYEQALAIYRQVLGPRHPHVATLYINMANQMAGINDWGSARNFYLPALDIYQEAFGEQHNDTAFVLHKIGATYAHTGEHAQAQKYYDRALTIYQATSGEKHTATAGVLVSLGELQAMDRHFEAAQAYFERALEVYRSPEHNEPLSATITLSHLASLQAELNHFEEARSLYEQVLEGYRVTLGEYHPYRAGAYDNLGELYAKQQKWKESYENIDRGRRIARRHAAKSLPGLSEREQLFYLAKESVGQLHAGLALNCRRPDDSALAALAASWLLNGKGQLQEVLAQRTLLARDSRKPQLAAIVELLSQVRQRMASLRFANPSLADENVNAELAQLEAQEDALSRELAQAGGTTNLEPWVELDAVRAQLPAGTVLVDIARFEDFTSEVAPGQSHWGPARYAAWISPPAETGPVTFVDLGDAATIDAAVAAARKALEDPRGHADEFEAEEAACQVLSALSDSVLAPIVSRLPANTTRLIVSPDASLWLVPWSALVLADGSYAVERFEFHYIVSSRDLVATKDAPAKTTTPVIMADPAFDITPREALTATQAVLRSQFDSGTQLAMRSISRGGPIPQVARLPGTAAEADAVAPSLAAYAGAPAQKYTGKYALESIFKKLAHPKTLVMSTHGFFFDDQQATTDDQQGEESRAASDQAGQPLENPLLRCGLLLAGCNVRDEQSSGEDGILTGLEVVGTDLRGTELVVLSACQTGLGRVNNGEGVAGLRQAFQLAGARSVVATLWQIPDRESTQLMSDFFRNLAANQTKAEALRNAQLKQIEFRRGKYSAAHPHYWAAYTLTGG
jgi:CHAT domain-containing protein/Tfp pilus assembly protein PilF